MKYTAKEYSKAYDDFADAIFRHCYFRVFNRERARDITQETFIKVWGHIAKGNEIDNLRAFLYKTATNLIIDDSRKKRELSLDQLQDEGMEPQFDHQAKIESKIEATRVLKVLNQVEEKYRDVVVMRYIDDLKPEEIAEIIGETANNVSVRLNRGVAKTRELLKQNGEIF